MAVPIIVPSHKRSKTLFAPYTIANTEVCIPESQLAEYQSDHPDVKFVTHPDSVIGISAKRQWIYDKYGDVFMVDDDVTVVRRMMLPPEYERTEEMEDFKDELTPDEAYEVIQHLYELAKDMGAYVYGFTHVGNPKHVKPQTPFSFNSLLSGHCMGLLKSDKLAYPTDEGAKSCEDHYMCLLCAYYHRFWLVDNRYGFIRYPTDKNSGGMADHRTIDQEKLAYQYMKEKFGDVVQLKDKTGEKRQGHAHPYERAIRMPY